MQALILAGGKGIRLRPLTVYTPKPVVPVMNRPFLLYQIEILKLAGITDIILSLNYQPDKIQDLLGDGAKYGVKLTYLTEPQPLGTAGAFGFAREMITRPTVVLNGDILTNLQISRMAEAHRAKQAEATIYLTPVEDPTAYGLVETARDQKVERFREKPKADEIEKLTTNNINAGVYILEPDILKLIPEGENYSFEYNVFPELLKKGKGFYAFIDPDAYWRDIGTPQSYLAAHYDFLAGKVAGFKFGEPKAESSIKDGVVDETSVIGADCVIKAGAKVINSVLGPGVHLDEKAVVENSVVWEHTFIGNSAVIRNSFVGRGCHIGSDVVVKEGSILGDKTALTTTQMFDDGNRS